ncbi:peroxide stress protein YaaA [Clostridium sp.]|uniref:peroxide stress protein YaaA n=1 Tax=Clostridium sp. TaxID=1506 RepID=UPI002FCC2057
MIVILSPAKTINLNKNINTNVFTEPTFIKEANLLMEELMNYTPPELESLMKINSDLAEKNFVRHLHWNRVHDLSNGRQALLAYDGAVYQGIHAQDFNAEQLYFANQHIRILSGLYGALRPLDIIQPYRLEMATKLKNTEGSNLYSFWKNQLTSYFMKELNFQGDNVVINLASREYSSAIDLEKINAKVITPVFKDYKGGTYKVITIYAKRARGIMSRFIVENRITSPSGLKNFDEEGYSYSEDLSTESEWVFIR